MNSELLINGIDSLGDNIDDTKLQQFARYSALLKEWNEKMNLTAICDDDGISVKHFLDSILPLYHTAIPKGAKIADIGTGAGFPGIPLKIMRPDLEVVLLDSLQKRIRFLEEVCKELNLKNVTCIHGRAEELGKNQKYREKFDVVTSRAVANLKLLGEYCIPLVKKDGIFLALKAEDIDQELSEAKPMLGNLGGEVTNVISAILPNSDMTRKFVIIKKVKPTPPQFPRSANKLKKSK